MTVGPGALLLVGNPDPVHVGAHLMEGAQAAHVDAVLMDARRGFSGPGWAQKANWWLRGHRPSRLREFSASVVEAVASGRYSHLLATGLAPLEAPALRAIAAAGVRRLNFLTDDPWNPAHRAPWFLDALREYDHVFTPRRANVRDLQSLGGPTVSYLPFAYSPTQHFPEAPNGGASQRFSADVMFAGGADADRVAALRPFIDAGLDVALYGGYWDRDATTRGFARGFVSGPELRAAVASAKVCLCLVRSANRDGHAMRTFEVAAMAGCMLVEDTPEHREILGDEGAAVRYFRTAAEAARLARDLVASPQERQRLAGNVRARIAGGTHTYSDRLTEMLRLTPSPLVSTRG